jgi:hypothetical protein
MSEKLLDACTSGDVEDVKKILALKGTNVHYKNDAPLLMAIIRNRLDIIKVLLEHVPVTSIANIEFAISLDGYKNKKITKYINKQLLLAKINAL